jgi:hypothetical protein
LKIIEFETHCIQLSGCNVIVNFQELLGHKLGNLLEVGLPLKLLLLMSRRIDKRRRLEVLYWEDRV